MHLLIIPGVIALVLIAAIVAMAVGALCLLGMHADQLRADINEITEEKL
jgi:hypothetical protein